MVLTGMHTQQYLQIVLPNEIRPRCRHSAVVFGLGPDFRAVVIFGGEHGGRISETTLLLLGE